MLFGKDLKFVSLLMNGMKLKADRYTLTDEASGATLDRGYLISAKDLGAWEHLAEISAAGIGCLKIEGRKKKPEYVATVTKGYREWLDRVASTR